jgi:hypothetical protein
MLTCSASLVLLSSLMISCVVYLFGDLGFTILKDSYLIQKALEVRVCSYVWRLVLSLTLLTAGRGHVGLLWHSYNGLSYNSSLLYWILPLI